MNSIPTSLFKIGEIVTLETHFYNEDNEAQLIILTGDPELISPMLVIEEIVHFNPSADSHNLKNAANFKCKCIWFSHKRCQFEEAWINSYLLKKIKLNQIPKKQDFTKGDFVELKTSQIEIGKRKSTQKKTNDLVSTSTTSHLDFVSPIMQVIDIINQDNKEVLHSHGKNSTRIISSTLIKCKYFNSVHEKFSEIILSKESVNFVEKVNFSYLNSIKSTIKASKYLEIAFSEIWEKIQDYQSDSLIKKTEIISSKTLLNPKAINYRLGRYYLVGYNLILNREIEIDFNNITSLIEKESFYVEQLPDFKVENGHLKISSINLSEIEKLFKRIGNDKFIIINYIDKFENKTVRTIKDYMLIEAMEKDFNGNDKSASYLKAFCLLRKDQRFFRIEKIISLKVLNI